MKLGIFTALLVIGMGALFVGFGGEPDQPARTNQASDTSSLSEEEQQRNLEAFVESQAPEQEFTTESSSGAFLPYTETAIADSENDTVVLFFNAAWCPTCQVAKKTLSENANNLPSGITILDADFDANSDLRKEYGVTVQHTFVQVDKNGEFVKKWTGSYTPEQIAGQVI